MNGGVGGPGVGGYLGMRRNLTSWVQYWKKGCRCRRATNSRKGEKNTNLKYESLNKYWEFVQRAFSELQGRKARGERRGGEVRSALWLGSEAPR